MDSRVDPSVANAFKKCDVNGDGSVSKKDLWDSLPSTAGLSKADFDTLFKAIDTDNNGSINIEEYSTFMGKVRGSDKKRTKSCMKVSTQRDSLSERPKKKHNHHHTFHSGKSTDTTGNRRGGMLKARILKSFHHKLDLDQDVSVGKANRNAESKSLLRFFDVEIREYEVTVSDNPGVKAGVAIELGWSYNILERTHLDAFEEQRGPQRAKKFTKEKKLTRLEREKILREFGATQSEIQGAAKRAATIRNARKKSIGMRHHDKLYEDVEKITNPFKKMFRRKSVDKAPEIVEVDVERLHPTLMAMLGANGEVGESGNGGE